MVGKGKEFIESQIGLVERPPTSSVAHLGWNFCFGIDLTNLSLVLAGWQTSFRAYDCCPRFVTNQMCVPFVCKLEDPDF